LAVHLDDWGSEILCIILKRETHHEEELTTRLPKKSTSTVLREGDKICLRGSERSKLEQGGGENRGGGACCMAKCHALVDDEKWRRPLFRRLGVSFGVNCLKETTRGFEKGHEKQCRRGSLCCLFGEGGRTRTIHAAVIGDA